MTHNPTIHKVGSTYLLFYIGTTYNFALPAEAITNEMFMAARMNQRIGLATAPSPWGPWTRRDDPVLDVNPGHWDSLLTVNPAPAIKSDGSILLVYKSTSSESGVLQLGVAFAADFTQPFVRLTNEPISFFLETNFWAQLDNQHLEDPYIWWNGQNYEMIMKDLTGQICGQIGCGAYASSVDGLDWDIPLASTAWTRSIAWDSGEKILMSAADRPQIFIEDGIPKYLFLATGSGSGGQFMVMDHTWNMCIPLGNQELAQ